MIGIATTFVLGAGASASYRLPLASDLKKESQVLLKRPGDLYESLAEAAGGPRNTLAWRSFLERVAEHPLPSIDAVLETEPPGPTRAWGRALVAGLLGQHLASRHAITVDDDDKWLDYIFERMARGASSPARFVEGNRRVRFVTFNFDSVFETVFADLLHRTYRAHPEAEISKAIEAFPVVHVHGQLPLPVQMATFFGGQGKTVAQEWIKAAAEKIRIVHDELDPGTRESARAAVRECSVLCFLGFSYHPVNLETLDVDAAMQRPSFPKAFGSAYGMSDAEKASTTRLFRRGIQFPPANNPKIAKCFETLNSVEIIRDSE